MGRLWRRETPTATCARGVTGTDLPRGGAGVLGPPHPPAAKRGGARTSQLLSAAQLHLVLVHGGVDGLEVGHDGQKVLEVDLVGQAAGPLAQVPLGAARGCWKCIT